MSGEGPDGSEASELRWAAIFVWHHQSMDGREARLATENAEAEQARRIEQFRLELLRIVGERDDISLRINGACVEAEVGAMRFVSFETPSHNKQDKLSLVTLLGRCPSCGTETPSEPFYSLAGLGKMLNKFEPIHEHLCLNRVRKGRTK